jgi:DeoR/GlpR family transcriptional regulator of sugar metabolism
MRIEMDPHLKLISIKDAAAILGVCPRTVRSYLNDLSDPLVAYRIRGRVLFTISELRNFIERHRVQPADVDEIADSILKTTHNLKERNNDPA